MEKIILYNMEKREWPSVKEDEHWRSDRIYKCEICGCLSNEFYMWGATSKHPGLECPGYKYNRNLHDELQDKVWNSWDKKHPQGYIDMLNKEIEDMRKQFTNVEPNVLGNPKPVDAESPYWGRKVRS